MTLPSSLPPAPPGSSAFALAHDDGESFASFSAPWERLPEPVADAVAAFEDELRAEPLDWFRAFHRMLDAFEVTVTFCALVSAADYARAAALVSGVRAPAADRALETLRDQPLISTGFWWHLARETLRAFEPSRDALLAPGLYDVFFAPDGAPSTVARALDEIPGLRNRMRGHALVLPVARYRDAVRAHAPSLAALCAALRALECTPLVRVLRASEHAPGVLQLDAELRAGSSYRAPRVRTLVAHTGDPAWLAPGTLALLGPEPSSPSSPRSVLPLHPLLLHRRAHDELSLSECALFQGRDGARAVYLCVRSGARYTDGALGLEVARRLAPPGPAYDAARALRGSAGGLLVGELVDASAERTRTWIAAARAQRVYLPDAYVERARAFEQVRGALDGGARLVLIAGGPGVGKTSFLCRLGEELLASSGRDVVALTDAFALTSEGTTLGTVARVLSLDGPLVELATEWKTLAWPDARAGRWILLVDALDRAADPASVLALLARATERAPCLTVVVAAAADCFESLWTAGTLPQPAWLYRSTEGALAGRAIPLRALSADEVELAYERYRATAGTAPATPVHALPAPLRAAMRAPVVLRLVCEVFDRREVDPGTSEHDVFVEYARRTVFSDLARHDFVRRLVRRMAAERRRTLPLRALLDDVFLRSAVLAPDGPYRALVSAQVLLERPGRAGLGLAPELFVEFAFDATLGYLLLLDAAESEGTTLAAVVRTLAETAERFAPAAVALDLALRAAPPEQRAELLADLLSGPHASSSERVAARLALWLDGASPATLRASLGARAPVAPPALDPWIERSLDAALGAHELRPSVLSTRAPSLALLDALLAHRAVTPARALRVSAALAERGAAGLAAACAVPLLDETSKASPEQRREAALRVAQALRLDGSETALRSALALLDDALSRVKSRSELAARAPLERARADVLLALERPREALVALDAAIASLPEESFAEQLALHARRAETLYALGRVAEAPAALATVWSLTERVDDSAARASAWRLAGLVQPSGLEAARNYAEAIELFGACGALDRQALALAELAHRELHRGAIESAGRAAQRALVVARAASVLEPRLDAALAAANVCAARGDYERSRELLRERGRLGRALGRLGVVQGIVESLAHLAYLEGDLGAGVRLYELSEAITARRSAGGLDLRAERVRVRSNLAELWTVLGEPARACELAFSARAERDEARVPFPFVESNLAVALARCGRAAEGLVHATAARAQSESEGNRAASLEATWAEAELLVSLDRATEAVALLRTEADRCERDAQRVEAAGLRSRLAEALLAARDAAGALEQSERATALLRDEDRARERYRASYVASRALESLAVTAEPARAVRLRARSRRWLTRAGREVSAAAGTLQDPALRLGFLRRNPLARAVRVALGLADADDVGAPEEGLALDAPESEPR